MFLRSTQRKKNGEMHVYWNIVENKRLDDGRVVQRQVLFVRDQFRQAARPADRLVDDLDGTVPELTQPILFVQHRGTSPKSKCRQQNHTELLRRSPRTIRHCRTLP
jgi:hypothetical protein